nr:LPXTG cell wall anchor domain-containing protein [Micromonospora sp. DSM 115978]
MRHVSTSRWLAGLGVVGIMLAVGAAPVQARAQDASLHVYFPDLTVAAGHPGKIDSPILYGSEPLTLTGVKITYDLRDLVGIATLQQDGDAGDCTSPDDGLLVCEPGADIHVGEWGSGGDHMVLVAAAPGAATGAGATLRVSFEADGLAAANHTARIRVGEGVDIAATEQLAVAAAPGESFMVRLGVRSAGTTPVNGAAAFFYSDYSVQVEGEKHRNCTYVDGRLRTCRFDTVMVPGSEYGVDLPYLLRPDTYAPGDAYADIIWMTLAEHDDYLGYLEHHGTTIGEPGTGGALELTATGRSARAPDGQVDIGPDNNWSTLRVEVTGSNGADLAAVGDEVTGVAGSVVTATVGVHNNGPATLDAGRSGNSATFVTVEIPVGATVVKVSPSCYQTENGEPGEEEVGGLDERIYWCGVGNLLLVGERRTFDFDLRIDQVIADASGAVIANPECGCPIFDADLDRSNDQAELVLNPTGGTGDGEGTGGGDGLPITGSATSTLVAVGAVLLVLGALGYVVARRRRTRFAA